MALIYTVEVCDERHRMHFWRLRKAFQDRDQAVAFIDEIRSETLRIHLWAAQLGFDSFPTETLFNLKEGWVSPWYIKGKPRPNRRLKTNLLKMADIIDRQRFTVILEMDPVPGFQIHEHELFVSQY